MLFFQEAGHPTDKKRPAETAADKVDRDGPQTGRPQKKSPHRRARKLVRGTFRLIAVSNELQFRRIDRTYFGGIVAKPSVEGDAPDKSDQSGGQERKSPARGWDNGD